MASELGMQGPRSRLKICWVWLWVKDSQVVGPRISVVAITPPIHATLTITTTQVETPDPRNRSALACCIDEQHWLEVPGLAIEDGDPGRWSRLYRSSTSLQGHAL